MSCKQKENEFNEALKKVQNELEKELATIATEAERKSEELEADFDQEKDLANGVAATAGTVIGGAVGGPVGAVIGGAIGKTIGSLFTIETSYTEQRISLHVPTVTMKSQSWKFDVPEITMKDSDIIFNVPTLVMTRQKGPRIPHTKTTMKQECVSVKIDAGLFTYTDKKCTDVPQVTVTWEQTYLDVPKYENREQRIVIGVPQVSMKTQEVIVDVPEITMEQQDIIFRLPSITITFVKDAGQKMADAAAKIADDAATASTQKKLAMKGRITTEVIEPAKAMFECYKAELISNRKKIVAFYDPEIEKLTNSLKNLKSKDVPESDNDYISIKKQLDDMIKKREDSVSMIDRAIEDLDKSSSEAIESLLGM